MRREMLQSRLYQYIVALAIGALGEAEAYSRLTAISITMLNQIHDSILNDTIAVANGCLSMSLFGSLSLMGIPAVSRRLLLEVCRRPLASSFCSSSQGHERNRSHASIHSVRLRGITGEKW